MSNSKDLQKILVANRGEIALRIMRTVREMGKKSVAVYSDVDMNMPFARYADESFPLHGKEARETYLHADEIIRIAAEAGADAIHPGYGFLSENSEFAEKIERAGLTFIGPRPATIASMGDKTEARKLVASYGVPVVPGTSEPINDRSEAVSVANRIGYPVLIKAAAGGGGKGMRLIRNESEIEDGIRSARSEAKSAFGDGRIFVEKYLVNPRHIEFQILSDNYGNVVHLFERECSIQRRHQKVVEETPSTALTPEQRTEMSDAATSAARACGYRNAGTVEFILSEEGKYYFLEMNTRLQVEHPITELTTGIDIVREQIKIAEGRGLELRQDQITQTGHAIECRIYAEDVYNGFIPDTGRLAALREPAGPWVRVDSGVETGSELSVYYDSMIAKLSVWGSDRGDAIRKMTRSLEDYLIAGVRTTIPFCRFVMLSDAFRSGKYSTHFVEDLWSDSKQLSGPPPDEEIRLALILAGAIRGNGLEEVNNHDDVSRKLARPRWLDKRFED